MSVFTPKRLLFIAVALFLSTTAFAAHPSARSYARMAFDRQDGVAVLFGGESLFDGGTRLSYDSDETWTWTGSRWIQRFPANHPQSRAAHAMVWDSNHSRVVLFGGRRAATVPDGLVSLLNDTWIWDGGNWRQISTPNAPEPRQLFAMTYDSARDRVVLFGGSRFTSDGKAFEAVFDTWEFDGTTWTKIEVATPPVANFPLLAYDAKRNQVVLVGSDTSVAPQMYFYDPAARAWNKKTFAAEEKFPPCVNDASMVYRATSETIVLVGGVCSITTSTTDATWAWNGTTWTELEVTNPSRATAQAITYDGLRDAVVTYGGFEAFSSIPSPNTLLFRNNEYRLALDEVRPSPRSLSAFRTDPVSNTVWLFGGLNELSSIYIDDFDRVTGNGVMWGYKKGQWFALGVKDTPAGCAAPLAAYDIGRSKLVLNCSGSETFEFDGTAWASMTPKHAPPTRRFAAMVYDETLKKTVLFGGFDGTNYRNDTWTWDGTDWTEVKKDRPTNRGVFSMWYDPLQKKTIIYGGLGRGSIDERITRYSDMYSFNGTGWSKLNVSTTPGARFGAQIAVDPRNGKLVLFGGLRHELDASNNNSPRLFFDNDTWIWDGAASSWTKLNPPLAPAARQNGMMAWDPAGQEIVLFGGYAALYYSDTWIFNGTTWSPRIDPMGHRRSANPAPRTPEPPTSSIDVPRGN